MDLARTMKTRQWMDRLELLETQIVDATNNNLHPDISLQSNNPK